VIRFRHPCIGSQTSDSRYRTENGSLITTEPAIVTIEHQTEDGTAFLVDVELAMVDGHLACVAMSIRGYIRDPEEQDNHSWLGFSEPGVFDREISSNVYRSIRPGEFVTKAIKHLEFESKWANLQSQRQPETFDTWLANLQLEEMVEGSDQVSQRRLDILNRQYQLENQFLAAEQTELKWIQESTRKPGSGGRPRITDETLKKVAEIHLDAKRRGERDHSLAVSRHFRINPVRGRRWVMYARRRGFLPELPPKGDAG